jgi:hypothetical protein
MLLRFSLFSFSWLLITDRGAECVSLWWLAYVCVCVLRESLANINAELMFAEPHEGCEIKPQHLRWLTLDESERARVLYTYVYTYTHILRYSLVGENFPDATREPLSSHIYSQANFSLAAYLPISQIYFCQDYIANKSGTSLSEVFEILRG